jgi:hypothetical protein
MEDLLALAIKSHGGQERWDALWAQVTGRFPSCSSCRSM